MQVRECIRQSEGCHEWIAHQPQGTLKRFLFMILRRYHNVNQTLIRLIGLSYVYFVEVSQVRLHHTLGDMDVDDGFLVS